jgi:hypothetical protein
VAERSSITAFLLANRAYAGAQAEFRHVAGDGTDIAPLPLYADLTGSEQIPNPITLDAYGKAAMPVYVEQAYRIRVRKPTVGLDHETGVIRAITSGAAGGGDTINIVYREDLGLAGNGDIDENGRITPESIDDAPKINAGMDEWSEKGGAIFVLQPLDGKGFYIKSPLRGPSNVAVQYVGGPIYCGPLARVRIQGDFAQFPKHDLFQLLVDAVAGQSSLRIQTNPQGGGVLSSYFSPGNRIIVRGLSDGAANSLERDELEIATINDDTSTLTFTTPITYSYKVVYPRGDYYQSYGIDDRTYIVRLEDSKFSADLASGSLFAAVQAGDLGKFPVGSLVLLEDDKFSVHQVAGGSNNPIHKEHLEIVGVELDGPNTVRFNRRTKRTYELAYSARLSLLEPARFASVSGANLVFVDAPAPAPASRMHSFEISYGWWSQMNNCTVLNEDDFGTRGNAFRHYYSYQCGFDTCQARGSKWNDSGDGYGNSFYYSTLCWSRSCAISGYRHGVLFQGATLCTAFDIAVQDDRASAVDFHGLDEVDCHVFLRSITGGGGRAADLSSNTAIKFGNTSHKCGPRRCGVSGGKVSDYRGAGFRVVQFVPGAYECRVSEVECNDVQIFLYHEDTSSAPTLVAEGNAVTDCRVNGWADWLVDLDGIHSGAGSTRTVKNLNVARLEAKQGSKLLRVRDCDGVQFDDLKLSEITPDAGSPYFCRSENNLGLVLYRPYIKGAARGLYALDSPAFRVVRGDLHDFTDSAIFEDAGGNTGGGWWDTICIGFTPTITTTVASSGLIYEPLPLDTMLITSE